MNTNEYVTQAVKTASSDHDAISGRCTPKTMDMLHACIGLSTEANEALDTLKKHIFYGKELDEVNLKEEIGDLFWYCALLANTLDVSFDEIMDTNIAKLQARYGDKFSSEKAINRDLVKERDILAQ